MTNLASTNTCSALLVPESRPALWRRRISEKNEPGEVGLIKDPHSPATAQTNNELYSGNHLDNQWAVSMIANMGIFHPHNSQYGSAPQGPRSRLTANCSSLGPFPIIYQLIPTLGSVPKRGGWRVFPAERRLVLLGFASQRFLRRFRRCRMSARQRHREPMPRLPLSDGRLLLAIK